MNIVVVSSGAGCILSKYLDVAESVCLGWIGREGGSWEPNSARSGLDQHVDPVNAVLDISSHLPYYIAIYGTFTAANQSRCGLHPTAPPRTT